MSSCNRSLSSVTLEQTSDSFFTIHKSASSARINPSLGSTVLRRSYAKQVMLRTPRLSLSPSSGSRPCSFLRPSCDSVIAQKWKFRLFGLNSCKNLGFSEVSFCRNSGLLVKGETEETPISLCLSLSNHANFHGLGPNGHAGFVEAEKAFSTDVKDDVLSGDEIQEKLLDEMTKEEEGEMARVAHQTLKNRQIKLETESWQQAVNEYRELLSKMYKHKLVPNLPYVKSLFVDWFEALSDGIMEEQKAIRERKCMAKYARYFDLLPADVMSIITLHKLMGLLMSGSGYGSAKVVEAACEIGEALEQEVRIHKFLEKTKKKKGDRDTKTEEGGADAIIQGQQKLRKTVDNLMKKQKRRQVLKIVDAQEDLEPWGTSERARVGSRLIELLVRTAYVHPPADQLDVDPPDLRPAFVHKGTNTDPDRKKIKQKYGVIECDLLVMEGLEKAPRHMAIPYMPMLVPPEKWTGYNRGAYLVLHSFVMRASGSRYQREAVKSAPKKQLRLVFEALDMLGNTKWRVNNKVLSVVDEIWASGGGLAGLVGRDDVPLPEKPDTEDQSEVIKWKWKVRSVMKENRERPSQRCDVELKLAVARKMKDEEGFFYPHNVDFRGRAYPMHPYLNHVDSDMCRGILEFAEGRPLGRSGLQWLKIHLSKLYAHDVNKWSHEGRLAFAENNLGDIFDSADKPLEGRRWWLKAEYPFQCLAVCIDLAAALRSPTPEAFISHIPVHQDGSCNELQHCAALGRDKLGAAVVNLVAAEKPADGITGRVLEIMQTDAQNDPAVFPNAIHARQLVNQVDRKLVKQTVMASVYGVTSVGARNQIRKRLKECGAFNHGWELFAASDYAARTMLTALGEMFPAAHDIMSWLGDCAKIIASENQPVGWTTPLGLPVVQPYCKREQHLINTSLQRLMLERETEKSQILVNQQITAFPPNFIHSLDSSHMMMTALACRKAGLNFAGVHDSCWTHACDVDEMNRILREKFIELYEQPILENLLEGFQQAFPSLSFPPLPERGDLNVREVLDSPYFFN